MLKCFSGAALTLLMFPLFPIPLSADERPGEQNAAELEPR
jgi:hypothetical protein